MKMHAPAAVVEDAFNRAVNAVLVRCGWRPVMVPHVGYASDDFVRVLGRVVLSGTSDELVPDHDVRRGWRNFVTAEVPRAEVLLDVQGVRHRVVTDRSGHLDVRLPNPGLTPGLTHVTAHLDGTTAEIPVVVVAADERFGVVSDIDDTVIDTALPRPLLAAYNTFVKGEGSRTAVAGMADLYAWLLAGHPTAPVVYVSTGAWNTLATIRRFLRRHAYPEGPLLMTDWGPTNTGWFRSGPEHKRRCLASLADDFPHITWLLVGDDGQHDPELYAELARERPGHVRAIAIRQVGAGATREAPRLVGDVVEVRGPGGGTLRRELEAAGVDLD